MRLILASGLAALLLAQPVLAAQHQPKKEVSDQTKAIHKDIEATLGILPGFFKDFPAEALPGAWAETKGLLMNDRTAIPSKYKDLIGLAVAAQVPCHYCIYFHTEIAKFNGATDAEIKQAIAESALTTRWNAFFQGGSHDEAELRAEITQVVMNMKKYKDTMEASGKPMPDYAATMAGIAQISTMTPEMVMKDIEQMVGFVPNFIKSFPKEALPGAWSELKAVEFNPYGAMPSKYVMLTSLATATQGTGSTCTLFAQETLKHIENATDREMAEAVAVAGNVRHWSTYLNGIQYDEPTFRKEVDHMIQTMKKRRMEQKPKA